MSHFAPISRGPELTDDERRLAQMDEAIADEEARTRAREAAERKAEEERQQREREQAQRGYTLGDLVRARASLAQRVAAQQHHLKLDSERDVLLHRADRLRARRDELRDELAAVESELAIIEAKLT